MEESCIGQKSLKSPLRLQSTGRKREKIYKHMFESSIVMIYLHDIQTYYEFVLDRQSLWKCSGTD